MKERSVSFGCVIHTISRGRESNVRALCRIFVLILAVHTGALYAFDSHEHREIGNAAFFTAMTWLDRATAGTTDQLLLSPNLFVTDLPAGQKTGQISAVADGKELTFFSFGELVKLYGFPERREPYDRNRNA